MGLGFKSLTLFRSLSTRPFFFDSHALLGFGQQTCLFFSPLPRFLDFTTTTRQFRRRLNQGLLLQTKLLFLNTTSLFCLLQQALLLSLAAGLFFLANASFFFRTKTSFCFGSTACFFFGKPTSRLHLCSLSRHFFRSSSLRFVFYMEAIFFFAAVMCFLLHSVSRFSLCPF